MFPAHLMKVILDSILNNIIRETVEVANVALLSLYHVGPQSLLDVGAFGLVSRLGMLNLRFVLDLTEKVSFLSPFHLR